MNALLSKRVLSISLSVFILGVVGFGIAIKTTSDKQQAKKVEINEQNKIEDQVNTQGQVAGVAITSESTPTPTTSLIKRVIKPTNTPVPSRAIQPVNQPQTNTNTPVGSNAQTIQNTSTQTSSPIYIPAQQPTTVPTTIPEPTEVIELQISYDPYEGIVYANKYLRACYFLSAREVEIGYDVGAVQQSVSTNKCYVDSFKSPKYINQRGYVVDTDGQIKYFGSN